MKEVPDELALRPGVDALDGDAEAASPAGDDPVGDRRRFDTRFFVAAAPDAQEPLHDDDETIESRWISPSGALEAYDRGELAMIMPTLANLRFLAPHAKAADALVNGAQAMRSGVPLKPYAWLSRLAMKRL